MADRDNLRVPATIPPQTRAGCLGWLKKYRHVAWSVSILAGLFIFLLALPAQVRGMLAQAFWAQRYLAGLGLSFGLLSLSLFWVVGHRLDTWVFTRVNIRGRWPRWLDWGMLAVTQAGNGLFASGLIAMLFLAGQRRVAYVLALGTLSAWLAVELVKAGLRRPRPSESMEQARIVGYRESGRSYPSGHTTQAFFLATLLSQAYELGGWGLGLYLLATVVAMTRIYVGAHYPRDVLAGACLGAAWGLVAALIDQRLFVSGG